MDRNFPNPEGNIVSRRWLVVVGLFAVCFLGIAVRLFVLQVWNHKELAQMAASQQQDVLEVGARRGSIYDRKMNELAASVEMPTVVANPREIKEPAKTAQALSGILEIDTQVILQKLSSSKAYKILKRKVTPEIEKQILAARLSGIHLYPEPKRFYPQKELAGQLLGFLNAEDQGEYGLEKLFEQELRGQAGKILVERDARQQIIESQFSEQPVPGKSLILTIDKTVQYIVEQELSAAVLQNKALAGTAVIVKPESGQILAMANYPDFNPNRYSEYPIGVFRNRAVADVYEPGSTFKIITIGSALDEGILSPTEMVDCQMGKIVLASHIVHDHSAYGMLDYSGILTHSSNIGAIKIGLRLGKERFFRRITSFSIGEKTGVDLPGEVSGLLRKPDSWSGVSAGFIGMGHEVGVTPLQMATVVSVVANGGYWVRPHLVQKVLSPQGDLLAQTPVERRPVLKGLTAAYLKKAMEAVVAEGTARSARMDFYNVAGKTGTAQKQENGGYSKSKYVASFMGYVPASNPAFAGIVVIDEPRTGAYYGGEVAAPVFKAMAEKILRYMEIPPEKNPSVASLPAWRSGPAGGGRKEEEQPPELETVASAGETAEVLPDVLVVGEDEQLVRMPDFRGKTIRGVLEESLSLGMEVSFLGSGVVSEQQPRPGTPLIPNSKCTVWLSPNPPADTPAVREGAARRSLPTAGSKTKIVAHRGRSPMAASSPDHGAGAENGIN